MSDCWGIIGPAMSDEKETPADRLRLAFELWEAGLEIKWVSLRREFPERSDDEISELLREWLERRPQAPNGDSAGRPGSLDRFADNAP